jgi:hypothetical protein
VDAQLPGKQCLQACDHRARQPVAQSVSERHGPRRYELHVRDLATAAVTTVRANFILACHGVHGRQLTPADRGLPVSARFRGTVTLGGRAGGTDSAVGSSCVNGKVQCRPRPPWRHCLARGPERRGTLRLRARLHEQHEERRVQVLTWCAA